MGFNWKAFTAAFLDKQTEGIRERKKEAKDFEEEEKEAANRNAKLVSQRNLLAQDAAQIGAAAQELGATREQVIAAMSSGSLGIKQFYEKLLKAANQKGVTTLGESDVEAIIDMPEVFEVNPEYIDGTLLDFAKQTYGAQTRSDMKKEPIQTSDSVMAQLFGFDAMNQAKKNLQDTEYMGGMSVADINELAAQQEYNSLFNDLGVNFFDKEFYGPSAASKLLKDVTDEAARAEVSSITNARVTAATRALGANQQDDRTIAEVEAGARELSVQESVKPLIQAAIDMYGTTGIFDHQPTLDLIKRTLGEDYLQQQLELIQGTENTLDSTEDNTTATLNAEADASSLEDLMSTPEGDTDDSQTQSENNQTQDPQTEAPDTEAQKETLLAKTFPKRPSGLSANSRGWDRDYGGKVDPKSGKVIIAPPRPADGGEKTKEIPVRAGGILNAPTGKMKKVTEAEYWDMTYGETHDPTSGLPFGYETLLED